MNRKILLLSFTFTIALAGFVAYLIAGWTVTPITPCTPSPSLKGTTYPTYTPAPWPDANNASRTDVITGWVPYTSLGNAMMDKVSGAGNDKTTGGTAPGGNDDIIGQDVTKPSVYYAYSQTYNTLYFRLRIAAHNLTAINNCNSPANSDPYNNNTWNLLLDTDGDGFKEFVISMDGRIGSTNDPIDELRVHYTPPSAQTQGTIDPTGSSDGTMIWKACNASIAPTGTGQGAPYCDYDYRSTVWDYRTSRVIGVYRSGGSFKDDSATVYTGMNSVFVDWQIPLSVLSRSGLSIDCYTPMLFGYSTSSTSVNPLQKDVAYTHPTCSTCTYTADTSRAYPMGDIVVPCEGIIQKPFIFKDTPKVYGCGTTTRVYAKIMDALELVDTGGGVLQPRSTIDSVFFYYHQDKAGAPDSVLIGIVRTPIDNVDSLNYFKYTWNVTGLENGYYQVWVIAKDKQGYKARSVNETFFNITCGIDNKYSIKGYGYYDANVNSMKDTTEAGTGKTLYAKLILKLQPTSAKQVVAINSSTGYYEFLNVYPGSYKIIIDTNNTPTDTIPGFPSGWTGTEESDLIKDISVVNSNLVGRNFGFVPISISGYIYNDINRNSSKDGGEKGLGYGTIVYVKLSKKSDSTSVYKVVQADTSTGAYSFTNIDTGYYIIRMDTDSLANNVIPSRPSGWSSTERPTLRRDVHLTSILTNQNFGLTTYTVRGYVYYDQNNNASKDGTENGTGKTIYVKLIKHSDSTNVWAVVSANTSTGYYIFPRVEAGFYHLIIDTTNILTDVTPGKPIGWSGTEAPNYRRNINVPSDTLNQNFGLNHYTLSGYVYYDEDGSRTKNGSEKGIGDTVYVKLIMNSNPTVVWKITMADTSTGYYSFTFVEGTTYTIIIDTNSSFVDITPNIYPGWSGTDEPDLKKDSFVVNSDTTNVNFGLSRGVDIWGIVYKDDNHNARFDSGEKKTGLTLYAKLILATGGNAIQAVPLTDSLYIFSGVTDGEYKIIIDNNNNLSDVTPTIPSGWIGTEAPDHYLLPVYVNGVSVPNQNFGLYFGSKITGVVFKDNGTGGGTANNGIKDGGEVGLENVQMKAGNSNLSTIYDTDLTNYDGAYELWIPGSVNGDTVTICEKNLVYYISTGATVGTTAGYYTRATDCIKYKNFYGVKYTGVNFGDVQGNILMPDNQQTGIPGGIIFYRHFFIANSVGKVSFTSSAVSDPVMSEWVYVIYRDTNCDGKVNPAEPIITALDSISIASAGNNVCLIVQVFVPSNAIDNAKYNITINARFYYTNSSPALFDSTQKNIDITIVNASGSVLSLTKTVDKATAFPGETLTYTVTYKNVGVKNVSNVVLTDPVSEHCNFLTGTYPGGKDILWQKPDGTTIYLTSAVDADEGKYQNSIVYVIMGAIIVQPGQWGKIEYKVMIK